MIRRVWVIVGLVAIFACFVAVVGCQTQVTATYSVSGTVSTSTLDSNSIIGVAAISKTLIDGGLTDPIDDITDIFTAFVTAEVSHAGTINYSYILQGLPDGTYYIFSVLMEGAIDIREPMQGDPAGFYADGQLPADPFGGTGTPTEVTIAGANVTGISFSLNAISPDFSSL